MSDFECKNFCKKLAFHTAPTLLGIKCASLIALSSSEFELDYHIRRFNEKTAVKGLKSRILCECKTRSLMLVYNENQLMKRLSEDKSRELLMSCGYPENGTVDEYIDVLASRINGCSDFPHEVGIFLGYPLEDVVGFIENNGENYKLCGQWKVYGCEEKARKLFCNYKKCRSFLCGKLSQGYDIYQALKIS